MAAAGLQPIPDQHEYFCRAVEARRLQEALKQVNSSTRPVVAVTDGLEKDFLRSPPEFEGHFDPHVWMDVAAWSRCVDRVDETLSSIDPLHAEDYHQNYYQTNPVRYKIYRNGCGRDARLKELWGKALE